MIPAETNRYSIFVMVKTKRALLSSTTLRTSQTSNSRTIRVILFFLMYMVFFPEVYECWTFFELMNLSVLKRFHELKFAREVVRREIRRRRVNIRNEKSATQTGNRKKKTPI